MDTDTELLRRFVDDDAQEAFAELVQRKVRLVYSAALRQTAGDTHLAHDVTQAVFLALSARARSLRRHTELTAWLFTTTRFLAHNAVRTQRRWQQREQDANAMNMLSREGDTAWEQLRPAIDDTLHELGERDREAILLRYFEGRSFSEIGASLGSAEGAARMRVDRALEKLRAGLARRGITSTAAALALTLANQPSVAVPAGLAATFSAASMAVIALPGTGVASAWAALDFMSKLKITFAAVTAVAAIASGTYLVAQQTQASSASPAPMIGASELASLQAENQQLKTEVAQLKAAVSAAAPSPLSDLRALVSAAQQRVIPPIGTLLRTTDGQLAPAVASLFKLTPEEKTALESSLATAREKIDTLTAANVAAVERPVETRVVIRINPFAVEGGKVHDEVVADFTTTLGEERYTALVTLTGSSFERQVGSGFGAAGRTITIDRRSGGPLNVVRYSVNDQVQSVPGSAPQLFTAISSFDRAGLEQSFPALVRLLPPEF